MKLGVLPALAVTIALALSNTANARISPFAPHHVIDWAYYGFAGEGTAVDPQWMAAHATYVEAPAPFARRFKAAGGNFAVAYTDPFRVIPAHHEPLSDLPESAWFHDASGRRISYRYPGWGVQNQLNPAETHTLAGFRGLTDAIRRSAPFDFIEMDDASFDLDNVFWHFSSRGIETPNESAYDSGVVKLLRAATLPAFVSGFSNADHHLDDRSGNLVFLPYAAGAINNEGCLMSTAPKTERQWSFDQNTLLAITAARKPAVCWGLSPSSGDTRPARAFFYASWLLTYDADYSIAFENFDSADHLSLFPEEELVPRDPVQTARAAIAELKAPAGYYAREFRHCFQAGKPIGSCVTIVNPTNASIPLDSALKGYTDALAFDIHNSAAGGTLSWTSSARPDRLDPHGALVLRGK